MNFADTRNNLVYTLYQGPAAESIEVDFLKEDPAMPSLRKMHEIVAADARSQSRFFLFMMETHVRHVLGLDDFMWGRRVLASPSIRGKEDSFAASLRPCLLPFAAAAMGPGESQERGFYHAHIKVHGLSSTCIQRIKHRLVCPDAEAAERIRAWQEEGVRYASCLLQESATGAARSLHLTLPPVGFSREQQRQCRYDGGEEDDGTTRPFLQVTPAEVDGHVERESVAAAAEQRAPGGFMDIPLTGSHNSLLPTYRLRGSFGHLQKHVSGTVTASCPEQHATLHMPWAPKPSASNEVQIKVPNGGAACEADLLADAAMFEECFARDVRRGFYMNQMHRCVESCVKYSRSKQTRAQQVEKTKAPLCRAKFYHVVELLVKTVTGTSIKRKRRRGKLLREAPRIDEDPCSDTFGKVLLERDHPFVSVSSDVLQVTARCNVDCQFLELFPSVALLKGSSSEEKFPGSRKRWAFLRQLGVHNMQHAECLLRMFQMMHNADYYITKYVAKPLQSMKSIMEQMATAMLRMESDLAQPTPEASSEAPQPKRLKLDPAAQAKRTLLKMSHAANRCFWQSAAELCTILLTAGDMLQTHAVQTDSWTQADDSNAVRFSRIAVRVLACGQQ